MTDPLAGFHWPTLAEQYDARCRGFDRRSAHLAVFGVDRPASDRALYHLLAQHYAPACLRVQADLGGLFEALLYWKYYSQGTADRNIALFGAPDTDTREQSVSGLRRLLTALPTTIERSTNAVVGLVRDLSSYDVPCLGPTALPTKTTLLHFAYPHVVPIFDKQVLKAVGEPGKGNHSFPVLRRYLPFAWELSDRYGPQAAFGRGESALRAVDMALWVLRDPVAA